MAQFILALLAALGFTLHLILWSVVATYRDNRLLALSGLLLSIAVLIGVWPFG
jgi:uncharacterized membrane protein YqjE